MNITLENAAAALAAPDDLTAKDCAAFTDLLYPRIVELRDVKNGIKHPQREHGTEDRWAVVLATGTDADLEALEAEHDQVERELERVSAQNVKFRNLETICQRREAVAALPAFLVSLDKKADAVTKARAALEKSMEDLEGIYSSINDAYLKAGRDEDDAPSVSKDLVEKVIASAKSADYTPSGSLYQAAVRREHMIAESLRYVERQGLVDIAQDWRDLEPA